MNQIFRGYAHRGIHKNEREMHILTRLFQNSVIFGKVSGIFLTVVKKLLPHLSWNSKKHRLFEFPLTKTFKALLGCAVILLTVSCENSVDPHTAAQTIKLLEPQDSFTLGHVYYSIQFNQNIEAVGEGPLQEGIYLRLGDETIPEVSPESAAVENSIIRIALPSLAAGQDVRVRIAAGIIRNTGGTPNEELIFTTQVIQDVIAPLLSGNQKDLFNIDDSYSLRFAEEISLAVDQAELDSGITLSIDGKEHSVSRSYIDEDFPWYLVIELPELTYAKELSIFIDPGLVKDASNNTNFALELIGVPIIDKQDPKVRLDELEEITETDTEYSIPFDKALFFVDDAATAKDDIRLLVHRGSLAPAAVAIGGDNNLILTLPDLVGQSRITIRIGGGIIKDVNNNVNVLITLPEITIQRDTLPPEPLDTQDDFLHLSDTYTIRFNETIRAKDGDLTALAAAIHLTVGSQAAVSADRASITGNQLIIAFSTQIQSGDEVSIAIDDYLVEDRAGNAASGLSLPARRVLDDTQPPGLAENNLSIGDDATEYHLLFNEKITNLGSPDDLKAGIQLRIDPNAAMTVDAAAIEPDGKTIFLDLPAIAAGEAHITVAAGLVRDASNNANEALTLGPITIKDVTPPALLEAGNQDDLIQHSSFHKLKFTEEISAAGDLSSQVYFTLDSNPEKNALSATGLPDGKTILVEHDRLTDLGVSVTFRIEAGALRDEAGNTTAELSLTQTVKADSLPPIHMSTDDLREDETEVKLRFNEDLYPLTGVTLEAGVTVGGGSSLTQAFRVDTGDAAALLVSLPSINAGDQVEITLAAGLFADASNNVNGEITVSSIPVLPETVPPALVPPGSTDIEYSAISYTLFFDEPFFPVGGVGDLAAKIGISVNGSRNIHPISVTLIEGGKGVEFLLPDIARGDKLTISIEGGAVKDNRDNLNEPAALAELTVVDTTPPRLLDTQDEVYAVTSYTLRFDEPITLKLDTAAKIKAAVDGQPPAAMSAADLLGDGQSLQLELATAPGVGESVVFTLEAGALADSSGNDNALQTLPAKIVLDDPTPPALLADQDEVYEDTQTYLIRYDERVNTVGDAAALAAGISLAIDGGTAAAVSGASIDKVNPGILATMPALAIGQTVDIAIAAGTVQDEVGNANEADGYRKTVLAEITPPTAAEIQDGLTDADTGFTIRLSEPVSLGTAALAPNIVMWYDNQEHGVSSAALTDGEDGIRVEFPSFLPAEASVEFIIKAGTLKDKRDNLNLEIILPPITVEDVTPPRLLEQQNQFKKGGVYTVAFSEDLELAEGVTLGVFKGKVYISYVAVRSRTDTMRNDNLWIEGANVKFDDSDGVLSKVDVQAVKVFYLIFPGGMLQDRAGNVIEEDFIIPPLFTDHAPLPVLGIMRSDEIHELDSFIEWSFGSDIFMHVSNNYELVQNISIAIDGGDPFSPIYATADAKLKIYLPPVFEGQEVEITLKEGQIVAPFEYSAHLLGSLEDITNGEISHTYTVEGHEDRQVRTLAGFFLSDNFDIRDPHLYSFMDNFTFSKKGFYFDHPRGTIASFNKPMGIDIDSGENIYVADLFNNRLRKITPRSVVTTAVGPSFGTSHDPTPGHYDGPVAVARLSYPTTVDVDSNGDIYILEGTNHIVRKLSKGMVTTFANYKTSISTEPSSYYKRGLESGLGDKVLASLGLSDDKYIIDKNNDPPVEFLDTGRYVTDIQMTNGRIFATTYQGDILEITYENGVYTETPLFSIANEMAELFGEKLKLTALAVSEDGNTFYTAVQGTPHNSGDPTGYIIRIEDYNPDDGSYRATSIMESFDATGTLLTKEQAETYLVQNRYFMSDYHYFPVQTFEGVDLKEVYGLVLDGDGHLIVSNFSNSLILKVFNPDM